jgi:hypothetical protein
MVDNGNEKLEENCFRNSKILSTLQYNDYKNGNKTISKHGAERDYTHNIQIQFIEKSTIAIHT